MKKLTAFLLALCLLTSVLSARAEEDAPGWAAEAYDTLEERSILGYYKTSGAITRYEFVELLVNLLNGAVPRTELTAYPAKDWDYFADTTGYPLLYGATYGIIEGSIGDGGKRYANGNDHLTREQAAKMTCSLLDFFSDTLGHTVEPSGSPAVYQDAAAISDWALPFTQRVATYELMKGDDRGNFDPKGELSWPAAVVMGDRILKLLDSALGVGSYLVLQSNMDWSSATSFGTGDNSVARPKTGWQQNYYTIGNEDGTVSALVVRTGGITVERFNADGSLAETKELEKELPIFGTFFDSGDHFYLAFGQKCDKDDSSREVWRIVQYDRSWNRLGSVSASGKESYTTEPFRSAVPRMAVSGDGKTVALYAARLRYDGHQSNITFTMDVSPFSMKEIMGNDFPDNHVSHSFGQFVQYDGDTMVTVDHGDAYPRSFVFQDGERKVDLFKIAGKGGENTTHAIGSGFEVTQDGYLFLGCSAPQEDFDAEKSAPWNVLLIYLNRSDQEVNITRLHYTWLTDSETTINTARLVKLGENSFVAMWDQDGDVHWRKRDGEGDWGGREQVMEATPMPTTQPVVIDGDICWIQTSTLPRYKGKALLYRIEVE